MTRIDVHTHILPPPRDWPDLSTKFGYAGWIALEEIASRGRNGCGCARMIRVEQGRDGAALAGPDGKPVTTFFRDIDDNCWDPAARIADLARLSQPSAVQVLSTVPVMFGYWAKPDHTLELSRWLNDHIAGVCRERPTRFAALGTIPMNAPKLAVRELERCIRDLGMAGVQIGSNVNGRNLGEPEFLEIFAAAQELNACVFVHPWEMLCPPSAPAAFPSPPVLNPRMSKHWAAWLVGMPAETCLAVCSILFSGLLDKLPKLRIGFAHGGGSFPGTIGRIDHGFHARPDLCQTHTTISPRSRVRTPGHPARFYVDSLVHDFGALHSLIEIMGPERIMLGSDYPFPLGEDNPGELIATLPDLSEAARSRMLRATALEFLGPAARRFAEETKS
jgi:aminocarboxymuconate-semialdehyde decarboxylase